MSKKANDNKKNTVFILFIPGGAMLGIIPSMVLNYIEELTETPAAELFQVMDAVSTGSIIVSGINTEGITAKDIATLFCTQGPAIFPEIPNRELKMLVSNGLHVKKDQIDPERIDAPFLGYIDNQCDVLEEMLPDEQKPYLENIRNIAMQKWITKNTHKTLSEACQALKDKNHDCTEQLAGIEAIFALRKTTGHLSSIFKKAVLGGMDSILSWADQHAYDENVTLQEFQKRYGDARMSDCKTSVYISTYDAINNKIKVFFSRKKDLFSQNPNEERVTSSENAKLWDATMASTANPFAYPPHITEDHTLCIDKAIVHTPIYCVNDVLSSKPEDADVKLVILGTGKRLPPKQDLTKKDLIRLRDEYKNRGVVGNLIKGTEIPQLESYTISIARKALRKSLGDENIIDISPKLYPTSPLEASEDDIEDLPNTNPLDASEDNIRRIVKLARTLIKEEEETIRNLSFMLVENLYNIGHMDKDKFERIAKNIGIDPHTEDFKESHRKKSECSSASFEKNYISPKGGYLISRFKNAIKRIWGNDNKKPPSPPSLREPRL